ncbi:MAG TPA: nicotinate-nucleotide adenylyltransferase [Methyloceanibacter sp.]|nr:nicotinate-nucleotide adenylyltransferase [Methyloceanibacter sp.]
MSSGKQTQDNERARPPQAAPGMRIGLLGGSFNPPHEAHRAISLEALRRLKLDRVWWLVAPRNPLKAPSALPSLEARVKAAQEFARHPRIDVTGFSGGSVYTADLLAALARRFPGVRFVWLMGADNLSLFHRWRDFEDIFARVPIAVFDRPGYRLKARASRAAQRFADYRVDETDAGGLADLIPPAWTLLTHPLSNLSSTALRARAPGQKGKKKTKSH